MKLTTGTFYKFDQKTIDKCFELAGYQGSEKSEDYWNKNGNFLKQIINIDYQNLTVGQRNYIKGILSELKQEGMI